MLYYKTYYTYTKTWMKFTNLTQSDLITMVGCQGASTLYISGKKMSAAASPDPNQ